jgi:uncharacterized membrane protein (DUF485 family)
MNVALILAVVCLVLWVILAFVAAIPSGWVHLPLAGGAVLLAVGIVESGRKVTPKDRG